MLSQLIFLIQIDNAKNVDLLCFIASCNIQYGVERNLEWHA